MKPVDWRERYVFISNNKFIFIAYFVLAVYCVWNALWYGVSISRVSNQLLLYRFKWNFYTRIWCFSHVSFRLWIEVLMCGRNTAISTTYFYSKCNEIPWNSEKQSKKSNFHFFFFILCCSIHLFIGFKLFWNCCVFE